MNGPSSPATARAIRRLPALLILLTATAIALTPMTASSSSSPSIRASTGGCSARFVWPVRGATADSVSRQADLPTRPWLPGHRGVDLDAPPGTALVSPADGTVSFAGRVGGKDVVAIRHDEGFVTSYEPATMTRKVGEDLREGEEFGRVVGESEHCGGSCVHWGLRRDGVYADPVPLTEARRIGLKPTS